MLLADTKFLEFVNIFFTVAATAVAGYAAICPYVFIYSIVGLRNAIKKT